MSTTSAMFCRITSEITGAAQLYRAAAAFVRFTRCAWWPSWEIYRALPARENSWDIWVWCPRRIPRAHAGARGASLKLATPRRVACLATRSSWPCRANSPGLCGRWANGSSPADLSALKTHPSAQRERGVPDANEHPNPISDAVRTRWRILGGRYLSDPGPTPVVPGKAHQTLERGSSVTNHSLAANQRPNISVNDRRLCSARRVPYRVHIEKTCLAGKAGDTIAI